jgi:chromosome segregation ATPase
MITLEINLTLIEFIAVPLAAAILGATVYFFLKSRQSLRETLEANKKKFPPASIDKINRLQKAVPEVEEIRRIRQEPAVIEKSQSASVVKKPVEQNENIVDKLKSTIAEQQKILNTYLTKVEELEERGKDELRGQNDNLQREIHKLHLVIEKKDEELDAVQQQATTAQRMAEKIEEVYEEFDLLQTKMASIERQAAKANDLAMELEETRQSYEQMHKELARKQEKLEEALSEKQRMHHQIELLEDKLAEANLQRQQLLKKVQLLQDLNADMQSISDANKKLQTEIRRIGELESMLTMMAEEREHLLKKKEK